MFEASKLIIKNLKKSDEMRNFLAPCLVMLI